MPTYVYECSKCEQTFEVEQRIVDNPLSECRCGSQGTVKRLIQPAGIVFVGSGFHINDYASSNSAGTSSSASADSGTAAG